MYTYDDIYGTLVREVKNLEAQGYKIETTPQTMREELEKNQEEGDIFFMVNRETGAAKAVSLSGFMFKYFHGVTVKRVTLATTACDMNGTRLSTPSCLYWYTVNFKTYFHKIDEYVEDVKKQMLKAYWAKRGFKNV